MGEKDGNSCKIRRSATMENYKERWHSITDGNDNVIPENDYDETDFKKEEKNHRAIKIIESGLSIGDETKVSPFLTAKEKWEALGRIHQGNLDVKRDRITALLQDWEHLSMGEK